jgi:hypothetical protein
MRGCVAAIAHGRSWHSRAKLVRPWMVCLPGPADYDAGALSSPEPRLLTHQRHWQCTAAMVLMPGLSPIKVLV